MPAPVAPKPAPLSPVQQTKLNNGITTGVNLAKTIAPGVSAVKNMLGYNNTPQPAAPIAPKPVQTQPKFDFNKPANWSTMDKASKDAWLRKATDASYQQTQATEDNWNKFADKRVGEINQQANSFKGQALQREATATRASALANTGHDLAAKRKAVGESGTQATVNARSDQDYAQHQRSMADFYKQQARHIQSLLPGYQRRAYSPAGQRQAPAYNPLIHPSKLGIPGYFRNGYHDEYSGNPWGEGSIPKTGSDMKPTQVLGHMLKVAAEPTGNSIGQMQGLLPQPLQAPRAPIQAVKPGSKPAPAGLAGKFMKQAAETDIPVNAAYAKQVEATNAKQGLAKLPPKATKNPFAVGPVPGQINGPMPVTPGGR